MDAHPESSLDSHCCCARAVGRRLPARVPKRRLRLKANPIPIPIPILSSSRLRATPMMRRSCVHRTTKLGQWSAGRRRPITRGFDDDHHAQLSLVPTYAAVHVPFIGRGTTPLRGGGMALELDIRLWRWLFLRVQGSHTVHPVFEESQFDEESGQTTIIANSGFVQTTDAAIGIVYALDIGRFVPKVDVGAGLLFARSPEAAQPGQWGAECRSGGVCDLGLSCNSENMCRPAPFPEVHAGIGLDVLLGRHWALGVAVRYYALLSAPTDLPIYLHGSVRLAVRF